MLDPLLVLAELRTLKGSGLAGSKSCFVGAPSSLVDLVGRISGQVKSSQSSRGPAILPSQLYIVALKQFRLAEPRQILAAYDGMFEEAGDHLRMTKRQRVGLGKEGVSPGE